MLAKGALPKTNLPTIGAAAVAKILQVAAELQVLAAAVTLKVEAVLIPSVLAVVGGAMLTLARLSGGLKSLSPAVVPGTMPAFATLSAAAYGGAQVQSVAAQTVAAGAMGAAVGIYFNSRFADRGPAVEAFALYGLSALAAAAVGQAMKSDTAIVAAAKEARESFRNRAAAAAEGTAEKDIFKSSARRIKASMQVPELELLLFPALAAAIAGSATAALAAPIAKTTTIAAYQAALKGTVPGMATAGAVLSQQSTAKAEASSIELAAAGAATEARAKAAQFPQNAFP
eukprot:gnl/MRDRNA2_/MRDRNA2_16014_c0_seq2.p1 gnl/MRDRNA2_/MRDRNA2_16014_c0~~gnl/MRDRNA2_/MRDRNA2_16014_c0_seq2.p1  ORF type:complete len:323 (+),score=103.44 gnl/MRDRNA2_/MRDRNA2_16014_c0_seq2:113-970(+)